MSVIDGQSARRQMSRCTLAASARSQATSPLVGVTTPFEAM
jgi:hypothetical protein